MFGSFQDLSMDLLSAALLIVIILAIWKSSFGGYRPVKHLFEWFQNYPMLSMIYLAFTLMTWGVIGSEYGLRTLLLSDDRLTQFLCGFSLMAIFLRLSFQYVVLDRSKSRWFWSLDLCLDVEHAIFGGNRQIRITQGGDLTDEANTNLTVRQLKKLMKPDPADPAGGAAIRELLNSDGFRILMAPLILDFYAMILLAFLGFAPVFLLPVPLSSVRLRIDWMLGCFAGVFVAKFLVRFSTMQFKEIVAKLITHSPTDRAKELAEKWPSQAESRETLFKSLAVSEESTTLDESVSDDAASNTGMANRVRAISPGSTWFEIPKSRWVTVAITFFALHCAFLMIAPGNEYVFLALFVELVVAGVLVMGVDAIFSNREEKRADEVADSGAKIPKSEVAARIVRLDVGENLDKILTIGTASLVLLMIGIYLAAPSVPRIETFAYLFLAIIASIIIHFVASNGSGRFRSPRSAGTNLLFGVAIVLSIPLIAYRFTSDISGEVASVALIVGSIKYFLLITFGIAVVRWLMTRSDPLLSYPISAIMGFFAFAAFYIELPESSQAQIPAAFSVIFFTGFVASCLTCLFHSKNLSNPKQLIFGLIVLILIVGQGWSSNPNQFKLRFPGLDGHSMLPGRTALELADRERANNYYVNPVRINSEAYFRISNRSVIKLHTQTESEKSLAERGIIQSNRLASGMIPKTGGVLSDNRGTRFRYVDEQQYGGGETAVFGDYLRLRIGDGLELIKIDMLFECQVNNDGQVSIDLADEITEKPLPSNVLGFLFENAKSLRIKLSDQEQLDSNVILDVKKVADKNWSLRVNGEQMDATITFDDGRVEIGGTFRQKLLAILERNEREHKGLERKRIVSALVTARWDAVASDVDDPTLTGGNGPRGHWIAWPVSTGLPDDLRGAAITDQLALFLNSCYLVAGDNSTDSLAKTQAIMNRDGNPEAFEPNGLLKAMLDRKVSVRRISTIGAKLKSGDCFTFENDGWESPIRIADFVRFDPDTKIDGSWKSVLSPHLLTYENLWNALKSDPLSYIRLDKPQTPASDLTDELIRKIIDPPKGEPDNNALLLKPSQTSGIFAFDASFEGASDRSAKVVALYNHDRVRVRDRILLTWNVPRALADVQGFVTKTATYEIFDEVDDKEARERTKLPGEFRLFRIRPIVSDNSVANSSAAETVVQNSLAFGSEGLRAAGTWRRLDLLDNYDALAAWKRTNETSQKPKLVIVTVSGGGIRSSVWTATVLDKLNKELGDNFPRHIRMITGASGGMVAASDFAGHMTPPGTKLSTAESPVAYLSENQLDSVIGQMIFSDIPGLLYPFPHAEDRGRTLERTWARISRRSEENSSPFERSLREFAAGEAAGWRPSIVYTPMMVEDGRRLLIANLDLSFVTRNLSALLMEESNRKIKHAAYELNSSDRMINNADDLLSLSAIEFFRIFPDAWDFAVGTATRMSASFPWVSPAVSLPTIPPRRIVDAGYYDNYGVNMAALWLAEMREWLVQNTSGILLIQIRDHESQTARTDIDFDVDPDKQASEFRKYFDYLTLKVLDRDVKPGLQPVTTPLSGVAAARQWTMSFRNDEQVELLDEIFNDENVTSKEFFRTVVFECPVAASLSWNLNDQEKSLIGSGFGVESLGRLELKPKPRPASEAGAPVENPDPRAELRRQLDAIGLTSEKIGKRSDIQIEELHKNVFGNRRRLQLLKNWWYGSP